MHAQQLQVKLTGIYSFNTSIISNGHHARKMQLLDSKNFFKSFKNKSKSSLHKQNKQQNENQGKYCKRTAMLDEKYTKTQQATEKCERCHENKMILKKQSKQLNLFPFDFMLVYVFY